MYGMGVTHWIIVFIASGIFVIPFAVILKRAGYSAAWLLLALVPGAAIVGLWIFAFAPWPALRSIGDELSPRQ
jgi:hypothetical protein